jgi:hypothetical protein
MKVNRNNCNNGIRYYSKHQEREIYRQYYETNSDNPNTTPPFTNTIQARSILHEETSPINTKYKLKFPRHVWIRKHNQFTQNDIIPTNSRKSHIKIKFLETSGSMNVINAHRMITLQLFPNDHE